MPSQTEVVVVGAGIAGLAAAKRLRGRGLDVTLLDGQNHTPPLHHGRFAGQCRRRARGRRRDQPVRPSTRAGRSRPAGRDQQGRRQVLLRSAAGGALSTLRALEDSTPSGAFVAPSGFAQFRGRPELVDVYASAKDPATAARLWELTEQVLGRPLPV